MIKKTQNKPFINNSLLLLQSHKYFRREKILRLKLLKANFKNQFKRDTIDRKL